MDPEMGVVPGSHSIVLFLPLLPLSWLIHEDCLFFTFFYCKQRVGLSCVSAAISSPQKLCCAVFCEWTLNSSASHGSVIPTAKLAMLVMSSGVTVHWTQPLLKPQYLGHLI